MDPLARLFGSAARLKLLRLFLFNDDTAFALIDAAFRVNITKEIARREFKTLLVANVIRRRDGREGVTYIANKKFEHYIPLQTFLRTTTELSDGKIISAIKKAGGTLRLVTLSGLFTGAVETKADIIVVGDRLDEKKLEKSIHELEAELGRELRYAAFSIQDFKYRVGVYDRLVRDIFDYPHRRIFDKLGVQ